MADDRSDQKHDYLQAPWRMDYIRSLEKPADADGCFLCRAAAAGRADDPGAARRDGLVLWETEHVVCVINRYPYTNGHLLVAPRRHVASIEDLGDDEALDLHRQSARAIGLLRDAMSPQGFNLGINLGRCAGAGLPGHLHRHVVPRWSGDVNFMAVVGDVRVVPQAVGRLYDDLVARIAGA